MWTLGAHHGVLVGNGAGVSIVGGAFMKTRGGGADVVGVVEGLASKGVFCFFKPVPS